MQSMLQFVSTLWKNTLASQQSLFHSAKLDQRTDLPSNASQAKASFHTLHTNLTHRQRIMSHNSVPHAAHHETHSMQISSLFVPWDR